MLEIVNTAGATPEGEGGSGLIAMASLPPDAAEQVRKMKALERDVLAAIDRVVDGSGGAPSTSGRPPSSTATDRSRRDDDPAHVARTGMSKLRRELGELEAIAEEQARPADRIASLEALAERRESHDSIRQILRDATLRAAEADALRATPTANDERDELLGDAPGAGGAGSKPDKPTDEAGVMGLADDATAGLRRARAMMAEELDKGRRTLAAMAESRATMKKTGDEYTGDQASALGIGGRLLKQLEIQAVRERVVLWGGFACFMLAALHVVLKRTPLLVRFHPLWWIRKKAAVKAVEAKKAAKLAAKEAKAAKQKGGARVKVDETAAALAAAAAASLAAAAMGDDATAAGVVDAGAAEEYLAGDSADDGVPDVEVGEYMKTEL